MPSQLHALSLRAIGQALESLKISAFALKNETDKFIVQDWELSFLKNIADTVWSGTGSGLDVFHQYKS